MDYSIFYNFLCLSTIAEIKPISIKTFQFLTISFISAPTINLHLAFAFVIFENFVRKPFLASQDLNSTPSNMFSFNQKYFKKSFLLCQSSQVLTERLTNQPHPSLQKDCRRIVAGSNVKCKHRINLGIPYFRIFLTSVSFC